MAPPSFLRIPRRQTPTDTDSDDASLLTATSESTLSFEDEDDEDDEESNARLSPYWCGYRALLESRGFRLDTCKDVKEWYHDYWAAQASQGHPVDQDLPGYLRACRSPDEDELCQDAGLVSFSPFCSKQTGIILIHLLHSRIASFVVRNVLPD